MPDTATDTYVRPTHCHACGAAIPEPAPGSCAAGYARMRRDGAADDAPYDVVACYPCADASHRLEIARADHGARTSGYLSRDEHGRAYVSTWSGGRLMRVLSATMARGIDGRDSLCYVRAVAPDGVVWSGRGPGFGMYVNLRRTKARA